MKAWVIVMLCFVFGNPAVFGELSDPDIGWVAQGVDTVGNITERLGAIEGRLDSMEASIVDIRRELRIILLMLCLSSIERALTYSLILYANACQ